jgi:predicted short-subunit dehydrogenase-like oxidoreductase (DUF2520 family)
MTTPTPNTFIVGAGPVATALAGALRLGGVPVLGLWARTPASARSAGAVAGVASYSAAPPDLLLESDAIIVAVRDDALAEVGRTLVGTGLVGRKHVLLHCSGAISAADVFADVRDQLAGVATMHPLRAMADARLAMRDMTGTVFGIEGDAAGLSAARALVGALGGRPLVLEGAQMAAYHAAAAMASNYVVALLDGAAALLAGAGVAAEDAAAALVPLARGAVDNVAARGPAGGLTGPIRRGDRATVERHLHALAATPELEALYRTLGRQTVALARRAGDVDEPLQAALDAIEALLGDIDPHGGQQGRAGTG